MTERSIWQALNSTTFGDIAVIFDDQVVLINDGRQLWIADPARFIEAVVWSRCTPSDDLTKQEAIALFWEYGPGWNVSEIRAGDGFPLNIDACVRALSRCGYDALIPPIWRDRVDVKI